MLAATKLFEDLQLLAAHIEGHQFPRVSAAPLLAHSFAVGLPVQFQRLEQAHGSWSCSLPSLMLFLSVTDSNMILDFPTQYSFFSFSCCFNYANFHCGSLWINEGLLLQVSSPQFFYA